MSDEVTITMSPTIGKIAAALAKAQAEMKPAIKDGSNPAFKGSKYASLVSYLEAALPVLNKHGIAVLQPTMAHGPDGVCVATLLVHESGEWIRGELYMPASKKDAQGFGSALTYARRYSFASTICLGADDDDGNAAVRGAGDLSAQLQQSVDANWPAWEKKHATSLQNAKTAGALSEAWAQVTEEQKRLGAPADAYKRLSATKDECKAALVKPANGAAA